MCIKGKMKKMSKGKKLVTLAIILIITLVAVSGTLIAVLVAGNQSAISNIHVKYTSSDVYVKVEAKYYVGSTGTDMKNGTETSIILDSDNTTGSLNQTVEEVNLTKENSRIVYEYKFTNMSDLDNPIPATISQTKNTDGTLVVPEDEYGNADITYLASATQIGSGATSASTTLNSQGLPAGAERYIYVIVTVHDLLGNMDFKGDFGWTLAKGTTASVDNSASGNAIVNVNTSQSGLYNKDDIAKIDLMVGVENLEPEIYPMIQGKCFVGWYLDSGLQTKAEFPLLVTETTKLYPKNETATAGLLYTYDTSTNTYMVGDGMETYSGSITDIIIADVYNDGTNNKHPVTLIDTTYFSGTNITSVIIPDSIKGALGDMMFATFGDCADLVSVKIGNGITDIADNCFMGCTSLTTIEIPDSVKTIGMMAFGGCSSLTNVVIGKGVNTISSDAFSECSSLVSAEFKTTQGWIQNSKKVNISATDLLANAQLLRTGNELTR